MEKFLIAILTSVFVLLISLILCYPIMLLWNHLMPVFGLPILTFWQMYGLMVLIDILFKTNISYKG